MPKAKPARPPRIYKYRAFNERSLQSIVEDKLYFADPSKFNDPLDTQPSLKTDIPAEDLEEVLRKLVVRRLTGELQAAARTMRYRGPRTIDHIDKHAVQRAQQLIEEIRYSATNPEYMIADPLLYLLGHHVQEEVLRRYDRGIVSLAARADSPLMWSHYGAQHEGICLGYSAPGDVTLAPVTYGGTRSIKASLVKRMLEGDAGAVRAVDDAVLLKKAADWQYEDEWRLIGDRGLHDSPLELEEIVFGMRCPLSVRFVVANALANRRPSVKLFDIRPRPGTFVLRKVRADVDDLLATWPRRARSLLEGFEDLTLP